jgi:hypothetical protein
LADNLIQLQLEAFAEDNFITTISQCWAQRVLAEKGLMHLLHFYSTLPFSSHFAVEGKVLKALLSAIRPLIVFWGS